MLSTNFTFKFFLEIALRERCDAGVIEINNSKLHNHKKEKEKQKPL